MSVELPPLPATPYVLARESDGYSNLRLLNEQAFTADQMRAYAAEALKARKPLTDDLLAALEHCADWFSASQFFDAPAAKHCISAIKAAKEQS